MLEQIQTFLTSNQFASAGLITVMTGAILTYLRKIPGYIWFYILQECSVTVEINSEDGPLNWIDSWLHHIRNNKSRRLKCKIYGSLSKYILTLANGTHMFFYKYRPILVTRIKEQNSSGQVMGQNMNIRIFGRNKKIIHDIINEARNFHNELYKTKDVNLYKYMSGYWEHAQTIESPVVQPILKDNIYQNLLSDVNRFINDKHWYKERGIRYKRNYILYGEPGNGKSSTVVSIAHDLNYNIYYLNLASKDMSDGLLEAAIARIGGKAILLLEDIDCINVMESRTLDKDGKEEIKGLSLNTILNVLDGAICKEGLIVFCTTNHIDKLDDALLRPGRIDYKEYIGYATENQGERLFKRFFPECNGEAGKFGKLYAGKPMCELEQKLIINRQDMNKILV